MIPQNYAEWVECLTVRCRIPLTPEYARERIAALNDLSDASTSRFQELYGDDYRLQVIQWFERSLPESEQPA